MLTTDEPQTSTPADPELLIEEARARQRQRRRIVALFAAVILLALAVGIAQFAHGGSGVQAARPPAATPSPPGPAPSVIYEKIEVTGTASDRPPSRHVFASWIASDGPRAWRETIPGRPALQYGETLVRDPVMGPELALYLYDRQTKRIYLTGSALPVPHQLTDAPELLYRRALRMHLLLKGTRLYAGHRVFVVSLGVNGPLHSSSLVYIDMRSYVPVYWSYRIRGKGGWWQRTVERALVWKTLPATRANLRLASVTNMHPGTPIVPERLVHVSGSVYNTEPAHIPGVSTAALATFFPLYWTELCCALPQ